MTVGYSAGVSLQAGWRADLGVMLPVPAALQIILPPVPARSRERHATIEAGLGSALPRRGKCGLATVRRVRSGVCLQSRQLADLPVGLLIPSIGHKTVMLMDPARREAARIHCSIYRRREGPACLRAHLKPRYQTACKNQDHACTATGITGVRPRGRAGAWRVTRGRSKGPYLPLIRCTVLNLGRVQRSYRPFVAYNLKVFQHGRTVIVNRCARASRSRRAGPLACPWPRAAAVSTVVHYRYILIFQDNAYLSHMGMLPAVLECAYEASVRWARTSRRPTCTRLVISFST